MVRARLAVGALLIAVCWLAHGRAEQPPSAWPTPGSRVHLHAHNCYPDGGRWADRIDRALASGAPHLAIEQDLVWVPPQDGRPGRSVVAHDAPARGDEPTLDTHFFDRIAPLMADLLRAQNVDTWPAVVLHLDFKTNEPEHHRSVWDMLGSHEAWLTTAERVADGAAPSPLRPGPLLVLTEHGEGQELAFHTRLPIGTRLRAFGTVPPAPEPVPADERARAAALAALPAERLIPSPATSYRRWTNHSWAVVEAGGPTAALAWVEADNRRLRELVGRAHRMGLWIRFYGLNGHEVPDQGWSAGYNFGSLAAVQQRWRDAIAAGVDFIATDQYEELGHELAAGGPTRGR